MAPYSLIEAESDVIPQVYARLRSYDEAGQVNPVNFIKQLKKGLQDIGLDRGNDKLQATLQVQHHYAVLPLYCQAITELWYGREPVYPTSWKQCGFQYTQQGNRLYLPQLERAELTLSYEGQPDSITGIAVPDDPIISDYLVKKLVYEQVHDWYINGEIANLERILQLVTNDFNAAYENARYYQKLPSYEQLYQHKYKNRVRWR